jgi:hypothetical protein
MLRRMNEADVHIHNFLRQGREFFRQLPLPYQLRRLVIECKQAKDACDDERARTLLREADRIRAQLERER